MSQVGVPVPSCTPGPAGCGCLVNAEYLGQYRCRHFCCQQQPTGVSTRQRRDAVLGQLSTERPGVGRKVIVEAREHQHRAAWSLDDRAVSALPRKLAKYPAQHRRQQERAGGQLQVVLACDGL